MEDDWYDLNFGTSRFREVARGASFWERVDIVGDEGQSARVRVMLEELMLSVRTFPVGQPRHLINVLSGEVSDAPYLVLCIHGDEDGLCVPDFDGTLPGQRRPGRLEPEDVRRLARLDGRQVLNLACESGSPAMGDAFLDAGAAAYAGPTGSPFVQTSTLVAVLVFRELALRGGTFSDAVKRASGYDAETAVWRTYDLQSRVPREA